MNIAIITGASSGMGKEFALQMDDHFHKIDEFWLIARREEELNELASQLKHQSRVFAMDITKPGQLKRLEHHARIEQAKICIFVQCAGYGMMGPFENASLKDSLGMIHLNCEALTSLTKRMIPFLAKNARIIMLASSAAFLPQEDFAVYAASKSYVLSFSRALARELRPQKIFVTAVCPGPVDTPFFDIAERNGTTLAIKKYVMAKPKAVVAKSLKDSYFKKELSVYGFAMNAFLLGTKLLPHSFFLFAESKLKNSDDKSAAERTNET